MGKAVELREVEIAALKPYERNAKQHGKEQVERIARSIRELGFLSPCLIDQDYNVIAGHGRILAAKQIGMERVPCVFVEGLTEEQRRAYIIADNRLTEMGGWNMDMVKMELEDLRLEGFDLTLPGLRSTSTGRTGSTGRKRTETGARKETRNTTRSWTSSSKRKRRTTATRRTTFTTRWPDGWRRNGTWTVKSLCGPSTRAETTRRNGTRKARWSWTIRRFPF